MQQNLKQIIQNINAIYNLVGGNCQIDADSK